MSAARKRLASLRRMASALTVSYQRRQQPNHQKQMPGGNRASMKQHNKGGQQ